MNDDLLAFKVNGRVSIVLSIAGRLDPLKGINRRAHHFPDQISVGFHMALLFRKNPEAYNIEFQEFRETRLVTTPAILR